MAITSGNVKLEESTLLSGSGAIVTQRGDATWGENYALNIDGLQRDILILADNILGSGGAPTLSFRTSFTSGDLSASGFLSVTHSLGNKYNHVSMYDENDENVIATVKPVSNSSLTVDLSSFPVSGTWNIVVTS